MKKRIFTTLAFATIISLPASLHAQENARPDQKIKTKSNIKNDKVSVITVSSTDAGCSIVLGDRVISPRDAASGMPTGKRMHKPMVITMELGVSAVDNSITEVATPKDVKSGQASGKVALSDIHFTITTKGQKRVVEPIDGEFIIPADCPDGECTATLSWSWGASNGGSGKRCEKTFLLTMENGACKGITEKGIK